MPLQLWWHQLLTALAAACLVLWCSISRGVRQHDSSAMDVDSQGTEAKPAGAAEDHIPDISSFAEDDAALDSASVPSDPVRAGYNSKK